MIVLIDDDRLVYLSWKLKADKTSTNFLYFSTVEDFLTQTSTIPLTARIYIDSSLSNNSYGELESQKIWDQGYKEIYLATGFSPNDFNLDDYPWIKKVVGKSPPF